MASPPSARFVLRAATAAAHDRVDAAFTGFALGDPGQYRAFLRAQAAAFLPVEAGIDAVDLAPVLPDWPARRRGPALLADLAALGDAAPPVAAPVGYDGVAAALGAIYVLEGSRLGGRLLERDVAPGLPRRFLTAGDAALWRKLIVVLDNNLVSQEQMTAAIDAARAVFARFDASARSHGEGKRP